MRKRPWRIKQNDAQILHRPKGFVSFLSQDDSFFITFQMFIQSGNGCDPVRRVNLCRTVAICTDQAKFKT